MLLWRDPMNELFIYDRLPQLPQASKSKYHHVYSWLIHAEKINNDTLDRFSLFSCVFPSMLKNVDKRVRGNKKCILNISLIHDATSLRAVSRAQSSTRENLAACMRDAREKLAETMADRLKSWDIIMAEPPNQEI